MDIYVSIWPRAYILQFNVVFLFTTYNKIMTVCHKQIGLFFIYSKYQVKVNKIIKSPWLLQSDIKIQQTSCGLEVLELFFWSNIKTQETLFSVIYFVIQNVSILFALILILLLSTIMGCISCCKTLRENFLQVSFLTL